MWDRHLPSAILSNMTDESESPTCSSGFAMGACAWARARGKPEFCAVADNDPLEGLRNGVESGKLPIPRAIVFLDAKVRQFEEEEVECNLRNHWAPQYRAYADKLRKQLSGV